MADNNGNQNNNEPSSPSVIKKAGKIGLKYTTPAGITHTAAKAVKERTIGKSSQISFQEKQEGIGFSVGENRRHAGIIQKQVQAAEETNPIKNVDKQRRDNAGSSSQTIPPPSAQGQTATIPDAFHAAFENEPQESLDPSQKPVAQQALSNPQPKKPSKLLKGTGKVLMYTSPGRFLIGKLMPRIKERFFAKKEVETVEKNTQANEPVSPATLHKKKAPGALGKLAFYSTPAGLLFFAGNKFLPKSIKTHIPFLSQKKKAQESTEPKHKKTLLERLSAWNTKTIKSAEARGYDRLSLIKKIRDLKVWKSRGWKYGKYALGPLLVAEHNISQQRKGEKEHESQNQRDEHEKATPHQKTFGQSFIQGNSGIWDGKLLKWSPAGMGVNTWKRFVSPRMGGFNNKLGGKFGEKTGSVAQGMVKNVGKKAGKKLAQKAVARAAATGTKAIILNPAVLAGIAIAVVIILFIGIIFFVILNIAGGGGGGGNGGDNSGIPGNQPPSANPIPEFIIGKTVEKPQYTYPEPITFTITYSYIPATDATIKLSDITVYDKLPANTTFSSASGSGTYDSSTNTVLWNLADSLNISPLTLTVTPNQDNIFISNSAYAQADTTGGIGTAPTGDNCNGSYSLTNPIGNFGDPDCYFAENKAQAMSDLYDLLKAQDPTNADGWYNKVVPCETGGTYSPNSYRPQHVDGADDTPDPNGAWGLFQMSMNNYNGEYDLGAVPWKNQIENAVGYGKRVTASNLPLGAYWACWR